MLLLEFKVSSMGILPPRNILIGNLSCLPIKYSREQAIQFEQLIQRDFSELYIAHRCYF